MLPAPNEQSDDPEGFWLKVECAGRETLTFRRNAGVETVGGLKERLEREWGVPAGRQSLTCSGRELSDDSHRLEQHAVVFFGEKPAVQLVVQPPLESKEALCASLSALRAEVRRRRRSNAFVAWLRRDQFDDFDRQLGAVCALNAAPPRRLPVAVWESEEADGPRLQLAIKPSDLVADVKKRVYGRLGFDFDDCDLLLDRKPLADGAPMVAFDLADRTPAFRFKCLQTNEERTVRPTDTAASLQAQLEAAREELRSLPPPPPSRLQRWNEEVDVLTAAVERMDAFAGHARFEVFVKTQNGKITLSAYGLCTVEQLKQMIADKQGVPVGQQRLIFGGKQVEDGRKLKNCGIREGATLHLSMALRGSALINETDGRPVPEHADFAFGPFDVVLAHRRYEHDFALLMRRVDELRALVHSKVDRRLVGEVLAAAYAEITFRRLQHERERPPAPPVEDGALVRHWRRAMADVQREVDLTKRVVAETAAEIAEVERELEELRRQLKRPASDQP